jgi:hypothetical protein
VRFKVTSRVDGERARLGDPLIRIFDGAGRQVAFNDDVSPDDKSASVDVTLHQGVTYIGVSSAENKQYDTKTGRGDKGGPQRGAYTITALVNP